MPYPKEYFMISTNLPFFLFFLLGCASRSASSYYYCMRAAHLRCDLSLLISPRRLAVLFLVFFGFFCGLNLSPCVVLCCVGLCCVVCFFFFGVGDRGAGFGFKFSFFLSFFPGWRRERKNGQRCGCGKRFAPSLIPRIIPWWPLALLFHTMILLYSLQMLVTYCFPPSSSSCIPPVLGLPLFQSCLLCIDFSLTSDLFFWGMISCVCCCLCGVVIFIHSTSIEQ